jgi:hypothetical protein
LKSVKLDMPRVKKSIRPLFFWYLLSWAGLQILLAAFLLIHGMAPDRILPVVPRILRFTSGSLITWIILFLPYVLFILIRSLIRTYRTAGFLPFAAALGLRAVLPLCLLIGGYFFLEWYRADRMTYGWVHSVENPLRHTRGLYEIDGKQRGVTFFARNRVDPEQLQPLLRNNVEWVTLVSYGFQHEALEPDLRSSAGQGGDWSKTDAGIEQIATLAKSFGMHVMLKPQIWLLENDRGVWISEIRMTTEQDWKRWFENYRGFILHHAELAARIQADVLCIGTELRGTTKERPQDWRALIGEIRRVYHGKLTYAANWMNELEEVTFWDALDYIGIQGYFPLTEESEPTLQECIDGWRRHVPLIEATSRRYGKPVLFTEIGFKSTADAAVHPWEWPQQASGFFRKVSLQTQADCYESFFQVLWDKEWFSGAHVWRWYADHASSGGRKSLDFTPQNKPAENIIARGYARVSVRGPSH